MNEAPYLLIFLLCCIGIWIGLIRWIQHHRNKPKFYDDRDPVNKSIGRHRRKILKKYVKLINREMQRKHLLGKSGAGLKSLKYSMKLQNILIKKDTMAKRKQFWER